jgi:hypothetical protein
VKTNFVNTSQLSFGALSKRYYRNCFSLACLFIITIPCISFGQTLEEFQTAASGEGVNLIPFADLRRDSTAIAQEVQDRKKETLEIAYDVFFKQKNNLLKEIKKANDEIVSTEKETADFKAKHPDGNVSPFEDEIRKEREEIAANDKKIEKMNEEIRKASDSFERLYNARAGLREYFDKALSRLSDVISNPDRYLGSSPTDDDRRKLKEAAETIVSTIQREEGEHKRQEDGAKGKIADFDNLIRMNEYKE